jgi:hypothetical protein
MQYLCFIFFMDIKIKKQSKGIVEEEYNEPMIQHQVQERAQLAELICTIAQDPIKQDILKRHISTIDLMVALCHRRELQRRYQPRVMHLEEPPIKEEFLDPQPFPVACRKTQCPFCIGDEAKNYEERTPSFSRPSAMMNRVETYPSARNDARPEHIPSSSCL